MEKFKIFPEVIYEYKSNRDEKITIESYEGNSLKQIMKENNNEISREIINKIANKIVIIKKKFIIKIIILY